MCSLADSHAKACDAGPSSGRSPLMRAFLKRPVTCGPQNCIIFSTSKICGGAVRSQRWASELRGARCAPRNLVQCNFPRRRARRRCEGGALGARRRPHTLTPISPSAGGSEVGMPGEPAIEWLGGCRGRCVVVVEDSRRGCNYARSTCGAKVVRWTRLYVLTRGHTHLGLHARCVSIGDRDASARRRRGGCGRAPGRRWNGMDQRGVGTCAMRGGKVLENY